MYYALFEQIYQINGWKSLKEQ